MYDYIVAINIIFTGRARTDTFSLSSKFVILGDGGICDPSAVFDENLFYYVFSLIMWSNCGNY